MKVSSPLLPKEERQRYYNPVRLSVCFSAHAHNSNSNGTFIELNLHLLTDSKVHNARNQEIVHVKYEA